MLREEEIKCVMNSLIINTDKNCQGSLEEREITSG